MLDGLGGALSTLLSPLDHPDPATWLQASLAALRPALAADAASALLPGPGGPEFHPGDVDPAAVRAYAAHFHRCDEGFAVRRRQLDLAVWTTTALWDATALHASEYWNDYKVPYRLYDALGVSVDADQPSAPTLFFYRDRATRPFTESEQLAAGVVAPAFSAAVRTLAAAGSAAARLAAVVDAVTEGVCVFDLDGGLVHQNGAASRLFAGAVGDQLRHEAARAARAVAPLARGGRRDTSVAIGATGAMGAVGASAGDVEAGGRRYRVTATCVQGDNLGGRPAVVVCVERAGRELPDPSLLVERFGLTRREADVTHLLMQGRSNASIATTLGVSEHTARHHTERVMVKLGVRSRAQVAPTLLERVRMAD
jgi:DNA-binding CsgD family transcriptional regulator/PAS domain-containing protein